MTDISILIEEYSKLLPVGSSLSFVELERRAGEFLTAMAKITDLKHMLVSEKIKAESLQVAVYAQEMSKGTAKTMTENKLLAESSETYRKAREELDQLENDISYLKAYYDIFLNAHVFYRNLAKNEG